MRQPPCQAACPLKMDIREYVDLIAQGRVMEAVQVIRDTNPFPSICAFVCTHPCESACRRCQVDEPVAVKALKRFSIEYGGEKMIRVDGETTRSEKIAIVGSGPAGLSCAFYLKKFGYPVTIFEAHSELGGMLREGIPKYRLPWSVLDTEIQRLTQMGVESRTNTRIVSLDLLFEMGYKAIFVTLGAHKSLKLGIEGENSTGVMDGMTFLREVNAGLKPDVGEIVGIVGGGNVAIDAARTSIRLGAQSVCVLYRRSGEEMPADPSEIKQAKEEGVEVHYQVAPTKITKENGQLSVTCTKIKLGQPDPKGRRQPIPIENSQFDIHLDTLITAIGQVPRIPEGFNVNTAGGRTINVDPISFTTNRVGVFAGGDVVTGPATVVEALASGRQAAIQINEYLKKSDPRMEKQKDNDVVGDLVSQTVKMIKEINRNDPPILAPKARTKDFKPVELIYNWETAVNEARRCLWCGLGAEIVSQDKCPSCLTCLRVCPYNVPKIEESGEISIEIDQCQACGICVAECPAKVITLQKTFARENGKMKEEVFFKPKPIIVGICCQYGLYGTGKLSALWRGEKDGIAIEPALCIAKVEADRILRAFEMGAEGVFIAGCGEQCPRENCSHWVSQRVAKVQETLLQAGFGQDRVLLILSDMTEEELSRALDEFIKKIGEIHLAAVLTKEDQR